MNAIIHSIATFFRFSLPVLAVDDAARKQAHKPLFHKHFLHYILYLMAKCENLTKYIKKVNMYIFDNDGHPK